MEKRLYWDGSNFRSEAYYWDSPGIKSQQEPFVKDKKALLIDLSEEFTIAWTNIYPAKSSLISKNKIVIEKISQDEVKIIRPVEKRAFTKGAIISTAAIASIVLCIGACAIYDQEKDDLRSKLIENDSDDESQEE